MKTIAMNSILWLFLLTFGSLAVNAQHTHHHHHGHDHDHGHHDHAAEEIDDDRITLIQGDQSMSFIENQGQWDGPFSHRVNMGNGFLFLEEQAFTYLFTNYDDIEQVHDWIKIPEAERTPLTMRRHAYRVKFLGAQKPFIEGKDKQSQYYNYILGNDPSKWASKVPVYHKVVYNSLYPGIDLETYDKKGLLKYDFIVHPGSDPNTIKMRYEGIEQPELDDGNLIIETTVQTVIEQRPYAYQIIDGKEVEVPCEYVLDDVELSFEFPRGYDPNYKLVIDPTVVAATLTGTINLGTNYNFGHTATFDNQGNIYAGGIAFGPGFPYTPGAFEDIFQGGETDIAIAKYNPNGTDLIYATFIGGNGADYPHSLVADFSQQLYIYGSSRSSNYPVTSNAYQSTNGGVVDIIVTKLNDEGSALVGSTYMGGGGTDGQNTSTLNMNYGDIYRGEIVLDFQGNAYVASCSGSSNFPTSSNAFDQSFNSVGQGFTPGQDGVVFKLNSDMSTLFWSTYIGGDESDIALGLKVDDQNNVFVTGVAGASNFPTTPGTVQPGWGGGEEDAFVAKISADGSTLMHSTFWGSNDGGDEHAYFLDLDEDGNVHIYGQTTGQMPISPNTYFFNAGSRQFLASFDPNLDDIIYSTVIGSGSTPLGVYDFVPVAFMVDKCNNIYFSGYYARENLPISSDAISVAPNSFYLGVLEPNASGFSFGTYYGAANHVDGGTSRFDKGGIVYQGVCSCTNPTSGVMNTLPSAWSTSQATFCDIGVFKIDFDISTVTAGINATAASTPVTATSGCAPFAVDFFYTGQDATTFLWDFDDNGSISTQENPSYTFTETGTYLVQLVVTAPNTCNMFDTAYIQIDVLDGSSLSSNITVCDPSDPIFLDATTTNATYEWQDGSTGATFIAPGQGIYWVDITITGCTRRDSFIVELASALDVDLGEDFSVCDENFFILDATTVGAVTYQWQNGSNSPTLTIVNSGEYSVSVYDSDGCPAVENIEVLFGTTPEVDIGPDLLLCDGESATFDATDNDVTYAWSNGATTPTITVDEAGPYWVDVSNNGCIGSDTAVLDYLAELFLDVDVTDISCFGNCDGAIEIAVSGGNGTLSYQWADGSTDLMLEDLCEDDYVFTIVDDLCTYVNVIPVVEPDSLIYELLVSDVECPGDGDGSIRVANTSGGTLPYLFSFDGAPFSGETSLSALSGGTYEFEVTDANGCTAGETVSVYEPPFVDLDAGPDLLIELGTSVEIEAQVFPTFNQIIEWTPPDSLDCTDCITPIAGPTSSTLYTISVMDSITGCTIMDEVLVRVDKKRNVFIPNAFTPNGDGNNDIFQIFTGNGVRRVLNFRIYDRWGEHVFEARDYSAKAPIGWDGTFKGKPMNSSVFAYLIEIEFVDDVVILYKGDVTLLR